MDIKRKILHSAVVSILTVGVLFLAGPVKTAGQNPIKEVLDRMDAHYKALRSLKSDVTMVKTDPAIGSRDTYEGSTSYLPGKTKDDMYARVDWVKPAQESMVVVGKEYKLYRPKLGQAIVGKTSSAKSGPAGALAFLSMSKEQLKLNYTVRYVGVEQISDGTSTWHLELTPKTAASYKTADLWVDTDGMPRQAKVTEINDDTTTVLLKNVQKNIPIKTSAFTLDLPKGTQIIKG